MKPSFDPDTGRIQQQINAIRERLAEVDGKYVYVPIAREGEPVSDRSVEVER